MYIGRVGSGNKWNFEEMDRRKVASTLLYSEPELTTSPSGQILMLNHVHASTQGEG